VGRSVHKIIPEVCYAIWLALQPIVLSTLNAEEWKQKSEEFFVKWQFPNCVGALDGVGGLDSPYRNTSTAMFRVSILQL